MLTSAPPLFPPRRRSFPLGVSLSFIAWGVVEFRGAYASTGQLPHVLSQLRWGAEYLIACHTAPVRGRRQQLFFLRGDAMGGLGKGVVGTCRLCVHGAIALHSPYDCTNQFSVY